MNRSRFLVLGGLCLPALAACSSSPFARVLSTAHEDDDRVFVLLNLDGGNDGLNTIVPYAADSYYRLRPTLAIPARGVLRIDERIGFNPVMRSFKEMYDEGSAAIVQGAGYPRPDRSHFRSTEIWQTAAPERYESTGWLGRYLDGANLPQSNVFNAVAVSQILPEALIARKVDVPAIRQTRGYALASDRSPAVRRAFGSFGGEGAAFDSPYLSWVSEIERNARRGSELLPELLAWYQVEVTYPQGALGHSLALAAQMIASPKLGVRVIYLEHGSFDTHAGQKATHDQLLGELSDGLRAFYRDLASRGNDKRALTMIFSEFGRRVAENASLGTDHGAAAPMFLLGGSVRGGVYGAHPSLEDLDDGDLKYTVDFRNVYATVAEKWFNCSPKALLGGEFPTMPLLE